MFQKGSSSIHEGELGEFGTVMHNCRGFSNSPECLDEAMETPPRHPSWETESVWVPGEVRSQGRNLKELTEGHHQEWSLRLKVPL